MTLKRVALYLQDAHDLRDGLEYARYAENKGFEAMASGVPFGSGCNRSNGGLCGGN